ncbi:LysR family transcriptional regulator [Vibrio maerlii]|uniref:LysR family transcriptional regulator n=1 Tax=Vibrio maerlii TaxID=2231648 RepID=UPI000E3D4520|nr:LysR family transcriptional regulator [Vibrio maerlii]
MKNTDFSLIPYFIVMMDELSISNTAKRFGVSQPAVSKALRRLKETYNDPLFIKTKEGYRPSSFCNDIYPQIKLAYDSFESTFPEKKKFDPSKLERSFNVACISGAVYSVMKQVSDSLYHETPHLGINIDPLYTGDIVMDLRQHRYDLCISHSPTINPAIECAELTEEPMVVAFDQSHPRLKDKISLDEFLAENHVLHSMWNSDDSPLGIASTYAHKRKVARKAPGALEMLNMVHGTDMICITPMSVLETVNAANNFRFAPLPFESNLGRSYLLWHKSRNTDSAHQWFRNKIIKVSEKKPQWGFNS